MTAGTLPAASLLNIKYISLVMLMEKELNIFTVKILSVNEFISRNFTISFGGNCRSDKFYSGRRKFYSVPSFNIYRCSPHKFQCYVLSSSLPRYYGKHWRIQA